MSIDYKYLEEQFFRVAPLPLYEANNYPDGFDIKIHSTFGDTKNLRITPEQLRKIEQVILGVI